MNLFRPRPVVLAGSVVAAILALVAATLLLFPASSRDPSGEAPDILPESPDDGRMRAMLVEATKQLEGKGPTILVLAHPTATYQGLEFKSSTSLPNGETRMTFDIQYESTLPVPATCYLEMHVDFGADGSYKSMEWGRDTGPIPPGAVTATIVAILEAALDGDK